jgi:hypothetical protein
VRRLRWEVIVSGRREDFQMEKCVGVKRGIALRAYPRAGVARIYCDGQYFYWAARLIFGNKSGN